MTNVALKDIDRKQGVVHQNDLTGDVIVNQVMPRRRVKGKPCNDDLRPLPKKPECKQQPGYETPFEKMQKPCQKPIRQIDEESKLQQQDFISIVKCLRPKNQSQVIVKTIILKEEKMLDEEMIKREIEHP